MTVPLLPPLPPAGAMPNMPPAPPTITPTVSNSSYSRKTSLTCSAASTVSSKVAFGSSCTVTCTSVLLMLGKKLKPRSKTKNPLPNNRTNTSRMATSL